MKQISLLFILSLSFFISIQTPAAEIEKSPRALVHLLDYLSADYAGAVKDGKVISDPEYAEQVEFIGMAYQMSEMLSQSPEYAGVKKNVAELKKLILAKASDKKVSPLAIQIKNDVLKISKIQMSPTQWPSFKNGSKLFQSQCASCHGVTGHGDGPAGKGLDPEPRNFQDGEYMKAISPFHSYNVIRLGIPGTGMLPFPALTDKEIWDLSFYVTGMRFESQKENFKDASFQGDKQSLLHDVATLSDDELRSKLQGSDEEKSAAITILRLNEEKENTSTFPVARAKLNEASDFYKSGKKSEARQSALMAYLQGIEPMEPKLKSLSSNIVTDLELAMGKVRAAIENSKSQEELDDSIIQANLQIDKSEAAIQDQEFSPWVAFSLAFGIVFREGFEAVLILIAILGVIRATGAKKASKFVHAGWIMALGLGVLAWFLSGLLIQMSGAQREMTEAITSMIAVVVLLYMGLWLHSKTEIKKWTSFIDGKVKAALEGNSRWGLFGLAFLAVFREAFETVLFMRAIWTEGGGDSRSALMGGMASAFALIFILAWAFLKYSVRLPMRQLFAVCSWIMVGLTVILMGKGIHSFQEAGHISVTALNFINLPVLGIYPTVQTVVAQAVMLLICLVLWQISKKSFRT
ncbi:MAG: cytochrome c/FTR1 family iron permease [Deltaproteobacteria bacterium]|nr:cytochrome c/FTR1 family iron permease [Deltaproteobacteria bacterium]